jgi:hypothetical protein
MAGAADRASVKQIMHMSSASCFRFAELPEQRNNQGRHSDSPRTPPQGWPQPSVLRHAFREYSCWLRSRYQDVISNFTRKNRKLEIYKVLRRNLVRCTH